MDLSTEPIDALAAVTHPDPYPFYARLREGAPLAFDARLGLWLAGRDAVVRDALAHPALRVRPSAQPVPPPIAGTPAGGLFGKLVRMNDGAGHAAMKAALHAALAAVDEAAAAHAACEAWAALEGDCGDLNDACLALPVGAVAHLLGFRTTQLPLLWRATRSFVPALSSLSGPAQLQAASVAADALLSCFDAGPAAPGDSPMATLFERAGRPAGAPRHAWLANLAGLLSQTCEASAGLLGNSLVALQREPGLDDDLRAGRVDAAALVAEVARHDPPVQNTRRFVPADGGGVELGGRLLQPGDTVLLVLAGASRDPAAWPAPDRFQPGRPAANLPTFGHGRHACPGQALALGIAAALLPTLAGARQPLAGYRPSLNARVPLFGADAAPGPT